MERFRLVAAIVLVSAILVAPCSTARADDGYMGAVGTSVMPMQNNQVTMDAERINAIIQGDQADVTCIFTFTNSGPATTVLMGFPRLASESQPDGTKLLDFTADIAGKAVSVIYKTQANVSPGQSVYAGWYTFEVPFDVSQTQVVRNTYHGALSEFSNGDRDFGYVLETGATWLGPIGSVDVDVRWLKNRDVLPETVDGAPAGYKLGDHAIRWHFTNLEPSADDNISVYFSPAHGLQNGWGLPSASSGVVFPRPLEEGPSAALFGDGDSSTAWYSSGQASGAWLAWRWDGRPIGTSTIGLGILPGAVENDVKFHEHGRPRQVLVKFATQEQGSQENLIVPDDTDIFAQPIFGVKIIEQSITLTDSPTWQYLTLAQPAQALGFKVVVQSVYPGSKFDDVAVSEAVFPLLPDDISTSPLEMPATGAGTRLPAALGALGLVALLAGFVVLRRARTAPTTCTA